MTEYENEILFYNLSDAVPVDDTTPILIDNENAQSITIINTSGSSWIFVNGVILYPLGSGNNSFTFRGNENELLQTKIGVIAVKTVGAINFGFCVIRKIYKQHGNNKTKLQSRFFDVDKQPSSKKRLRGY